ncbi:hypothetical protein KC951_04100 [Candidatus Saccharibacteria bacterium]|nr:hypothetical protein [Candidatus Saccharibacteria bacterium]
MAFSDHPSRAEILRVPGYLYRGCTSPLTEPDNWGTRLGYAEKGVIIQPNYRTIAAPNEESGQTPVAKAFIGAFARLFVVLKNWNNEVLSAIFPGCQVAGPGLVFPGSIKPGQDLLASAYTAPLLFVPRDTANNPCALLQKASANMIETAQFRLSLNTDTVFPAVFDGYQKTTDPDGTYSMRPLSETVLR